MRTTLVTSLVLFLVAGTAWAQRQERPDESVLLVDMAFNRGVWQAAPVKVLPCPGPSKPDSTATNQSMFQLRNRDGKVLFRRYIMNPRIVLVEDPKVPAGLLQTTKFTLRIPIRHEGARAVGYRDVHSFEFFERVSGDAARDKPSVSLRLDTAMERLTRTQDAGIRVPCQVAAPSTERMPDLTMDPGNALSPDSLAALIQNDRGALIKWGLENGVTPDELRRVVRENEKRLGQVKMTPARAERLIQEYEAAYRKRK